MTPFDKAKQLLERVEESGRVLCVDLPSNRYAQVGQPVVACSLVTVACTSIDIDQATGPEKCNASQLATFAIIIARDCSWTSEQDGTDDVAKVDVVSAEIASDADVLWHMANNYSAFLSKRWSVAWTIEGGLGVTTLTLTTGID